MSQWYIPPVHIEALSPRPAASTSDPWVDPYGRSIHNGGTGHSWSGVLDNDLAQLGFTQYTYKAKTALPLIPDSLLGFGGDTYWPASGATISPPWHSYRFADPEMGYMHFILLGTPGFPNHDANPKNSVLFEYRNVGNRNVAGAGDQDANINPVAIFDQATNALEFWIYFEASADKTIPANTFTLRFRYGVGQGNARDVDTSMDRSVPIQSGISGGWNLILQNMWLGMDPNIDWNTNAAYTDKNGHVRKGIIYDRVALELTGNIPSNCFDENHELHFYITGGRQIGQLGIYGPESTRRLDPPHPLEECVEGASVYDVTDLTADFDSAVLMDTEKGEAWLGGECIFPAALASPTSNCAIDGQIPGALFLGDKLGYPWQIDPTNLMWGNPSQLFVWDADPSGVGDATSISVSAQSTTSFSGNPLPVDDDGNGLLEGLLIGKYNPTLKTFELRRIIGNNRLTALIDTQTPWDDLPALGDLVIVAPLPMMVHWDEIRTLYYSTFARLNMNAHEDATGDASGVAQYDPLFILELYTAGSVRKTQVDYSATRLRKVFRLSDLQRGEEAWIEFRQLESRARAMRLTAIQGQNGPLYYSNVRVEEDLAEGEGGR